MTESIDYDKKLISDVAMQQKKLFYPQGPTTTANLTDSLH